MIVLRANKTGKSSYTIGRDLECCIFSYTSPWDANVLDKKRLSKATFAAGFLIMPTHKARAGYLCGNSAPILYLDLQHTRRRNCALFHSYSLAINTRNNEVQKIHYTNIIVRTCIYIYKHKNDLENSACISIRPTLITRYHPLMFHRMYPGTVVPYNASRATGTYTSR